MTDFFSSDESPLDRAIKALTNEDREVTEDQAAFLNFWNGFADACSDNRLPVPSLADVIYAWQHHIKEMN